MMEAILILATLVPSFRFRLVPGSVVKPQPMRCSRPYPGVPMTLRCV